MAQLPIVQHPFSAVNPLFFSPIPHDILSDKRLIPLDVVIIGHLLRYAKGKASCWPGVATLAKDSSRCERTVQYSLARLKAAGWISMAPSGNPTGRVIILNWRSGATPCGGGVQPYSQGLPRVGGKPVAPEVESEKKKVSPPATEQMPTEDLFADWLSHPEGHLLRELALARLAAKPAG